MQETITFTFEVDHESLPKLGNEVAVALKKALILELDQEIAALERGGTGWQSLESIIESRGVSREELVAHVQGVHELRLASLQNMDAYQSLLKRRVRLALLEFQLSFSSGQMILKISSSHVLAALMFQNRDWFLMLVQRKIPIVIEEFVDVLPNLSFVSHTGLPSLEGRPGQVAVGNPQEAGAFRGGRLLQRLGLVAIITPLLMSGLILFFLYSWVNDLKKDYEGLKNVVDIQKEQIIETIEEGLQKSHDVMNVIDFVKDFTTTEDTTQH